MRNIAILALGAALVGAPAFAASPVVGVWDTVATTAQGNFPATITIAETDDGHAVTIDDGGTFGPSQISDVTVDDDSFSFKRMLDFGQGPTEFTYSGIVDGDSMTATANSSFGPTPITGTRK
jgi:hypothetical protein